MAKLHLKIVSQERELLDTTVDQITLPTAEGEITVLPGHISLVSRLQPGELQYVNDRKSQIVVVSRGFLTIAPGNEVTVMVDSAVEEREISLVAAEKAVKRAEEIIKLSGDERERLKAEAELRWALIQLNIAERSKRSRL
ncbi:ATP synthase F1 subunit epsilon [Candidatus Woesebacteria bacterium]|nr:ATP synthase F1 subunit epsilon [Candidatus Woesebacteria bacterium]